MRKALTPSKSDCAQLASLAVRNARAQEQEARTVKASALRSPPRKEFRAFRGAMKMPCSLQTLAARLDAKLSDFFAVAASTPRAKPMRGWVYVIVNRAMPGLIKVGFSTKDPALRAKELDGTGLPHPDEVVYDALLQDPYKLEQKVHRELAGHREGKEWFRCSVADAITAIRTSAPTVMLEHGADEPLPVTGSAEKPSLVGKTCWYANCALPVSRSYKGCDYCKRHDDVQRRARNSLLRSSSGSSRPSGYPTRPPAEPDVPN